MSQGPSTFTVVTAPTGIVVSVGNSTTTPLGVGGLFTGVFEDVSRYQEITINGADAPVGYPGTVILEWSDDGVTPIDPRPLDLDVGGPAFRPQIIRVSHKYARVSYQNGAVAQTAFVLTTTYHYTASTHPAKHLNDPIEHDEPTNAVRAVIAGQGPDGAFHNVPVSADEFLRVQLADTNRISAVNATMIPLGAGGVFAGTYERIPDGTVVTVTVRTDAVGIAGGLVVWWSMDGLVDDIPQPLGFDVTQTRTLTLTLRAGGYVRVQYTNGPTPQTIMRLQTVFSAAHSGLVTDRTDSNSSTDSYSPRMRALIAANEQGTPNIKNITCRVTGTEIASHADVVDRAARLLGVVTVAKPAPLVVSVVSAVNGAVTAILPAAGPGLYHYITRIEVTRLATNNNSNGTALTVTTTNLPGALAWSAIEFGAKGDVKRTVDESYDPPLRSVAADTATTLVCPAAGASVFWRVNVVYYTGA